MEAVNGVRAALQGKKTYLIVGLWILVVVIEKFIGVDLPYVTVGPDWVNETMTLLGLGTLRAGLARAVAAS